MFTKYSRRLLDVTSSCRNDMHEPDEQGISVVVTGLHLDNAMGNDPYDNCQELTIGIKENANEPEWFNLASLIALARVGAEYVLNMDEGADKKAATLGRRLPTKYTFRSGDNPDENNP